MKKRILLVFLVLTTLFSSGCSVLNILMRPKALSASTYESLGIPTFENYPSDSDYMSRYPYDMYYYDGRIYVGAGDYDKNTGPVTIWAYDIASGVWIATGTVDDEAVMRFVKIGGYLVVPGIDPRENWSFGNYYILLDGVWETVRNIPSAIHNFDMVEYNGEIFCGIGIDAGLYPIARSSDNGNSYKQVKMYKNGTLLSTSETELNRVYMLYVVDDSLFALYMTASGLELYKYDGIAFQFIKSMYDEIAAVRDLGVHGILAWENFRDRFWIASGYLFYTENGEDYQGLYFPHDDVREIIYDIVVYDDTMYVLCAVEGENGYIITVYENSSDATNKFNKVLYFEYEIPAVQFAFDGSSFYFGMANNILLHSKTGEILKVYIGEG